MQEPMLFDVNYVSYGKWMQRTKKDFFFPFIQWISIEFNVLYSINGNKTYKVANLATIKSYVAYRQIYQLFGQTLCSFQDSLYV